MQWWPIGNLCFCTGVLWVRNPIQPETRYVRLPAHLKFVLVERTPVMNVARNFGEGCRLRCRPRHFLIMVPNYDVYPKTAFKSTGYSGITKHSFLHLRWWQQLATDPINPRYS
ncbi:hypothetical protein AVEN_129157-1 [Araneus ventricosus]|uniref:Uncharacterized protein n=1 Tax=Araneus ventricosus TaxID=182803 RepID=A0A4Y2T8V9_ARAVE|nr:hypothetical protein AVEN_188125-1 [Araneus ventricosus]GBN95839.1 hypothetical protein AVEN_129157-1 [Araneus ventricosus]